VRLRSTPDRRGGGKGPPGGARRDAAGGESLRLSYRETVPATLAVYPEPAAAGSGSYVIQYLRKGASTSKVQAVPRVMTNASPAEKRLGIGPIDGHDDRPFDHDEQLIGRVRGDALLVDVAGPDAALDLAVLAHETA
jgi:hypothetical protein